MKKHGKKYLEAAKLIDKDKVYSIEEGVALAKKSSITKFDSSVGISFKLNVNPAKADQLIRGTIVLPNGTGRSKTVLALTKGKQDEAKAAGAEFVGGDELVEKIEKENWFDYDVIVCTPDMMGSLGKLGRVLGPKGLMPNPKTGTVSPNIGDAVNEIKKGKIAYRVDKDGNLNVNVGKISFDDDKLAANIKAMIDVIVKSRPSTVKGTYIQNVVISSTMGPGIKINFEGKN